MVIDEVIKKTNVNLISIPQAVCHEALSRGYKKIGLLGTIFTMEQDYMKKDFREAGIIEAVVLGCTELPHILNQDNSPFPCLDSVEIHIQELIRKIF